MNNKKEMGLAKAIFSFVFALVIIAGAMFGLKIDVSIDGEPTDVVETDETVLPDKPDVDTPTEAVTDPDEVVDKSTDEAPIEDPDEGEQKPAGETDGEDVKKDNDNSEDTTPTDEQTENVENTKDEATESDKVDEAPAAEGEENDA